MSWQTKTVGTAVKKLAETHVGKLVVNRAQNFATDKMMSTVADKGMSQISKARQTRAERNGHRDKALRVAHQVHGLLTHSYLDETDDYHWIVWKDEKPYRAFPKIEGDLAAQDLLSHTTASDLQSPDEIEAAQRRFARKRRAVQELENQDPPAPQDA